MGLIWQARNPWRTHLMESSIHAKVHLQPTSASTLFDIQITAV
jgi:hypothetical protein